LTARQLAGRIAENVDGTVEIHANDTSNYERADIVNRLEKIFLIRFELYQRKFFVKYLNNMLSQTTPFLFYLIGGYFALQGRFDVGALVAVINAYKDLPSPIKELIDWDQQRQDVQIKYEQVLEQFTPDQMLAPELQGVTDQPQEIAGGFSVHGVAVADDSGARIIEDATIQLNAGEHWAVIGAGGAGTEAFGPLLMRLVRPHAGNVSLGGHDLSDLPEAITGRHLAYVGEETFLLPAAILDNILYVFRHRPVAPAHYEGRALQHFQRRMTEAQRSGNPQLDVHAQWIDYAEAGVADDAGLVERIIGLLGDFELEDDIYHFGLRGRIDPESEPELAARFLEARVALIERLREPAYSGLVEVFEPTRYSRNMTVAENILFGTSKGPAFAFESLRDNRLLADVIEAGGLSQPLAAMGAKIAETMVELFADLPAGHPFFEQFSFIDADDLPVFQQLVSRIQKAGLGAAQPADRKRLVALTFPYIEARHRLGLIDADMEARLLSVRRAFADALPEDLRDAIEFYDPASYNSTASVQDNILFGRLVYGQAQAQQKILRLIVEVIEQLRLKSAVLTVGLEYNVGSGGKRLSAAQRQKVALLRAVLRRPRFLILGNALASLETAAQPRIAGNLRRLMEGRGLVVVTSNNALALGFDHVAVMREGRIVEKGKLTQIDQPGSSLRSMVGAKA
jgi:putative ABC transport system ATP-binding protein